jgi:hypothetical protein
MPAFALPSLDDGAVRLNVAGRERDGVIPPADYDEWCGRVERLLRATVNPLTGEAAVAEVHRHASRLGAPAGDITITWRGPVFALHHPEHGVIGPFPPRRTGGHEDPTGFAMVTGPGIRHQHLGWAPAASVTPTITTLLGQGGASPLVRPELRRV